MKRTDAGGEAVTWSMDVDLLKRDAEGVAQRTASDGHEALTVERLLAYIAVLEHRIDHLLDAEDNFGLDEIREALVPVRALRALNVEIDWDPRKLARCSPEKWDALFPEPEGARVGPPNTRCVSCGAFGRVDMTIERGTEPFKLEIVSRAEPGWAFCDDGSPVCGPCAIQIWEAQGCKPAPPEDDG